jgi:hypothetical protein
MSAFFPALFSETEVRMLCTLTVKRLSMYDQWAMPLDESELDRCIDSS